MGQLGSGDLGDRHHWKVIAVSNPNQPEWTVRAVQPQPEGVLPPVEPIQAQMALTDPDKAGHQWLLATFADGTAAVTIRMPWQNAAGFFGQCAAFAQQLAAKAQAQAGPQLIVPPAGIDLGKLNGNGRGRG